MVHLITDVQTTSAPVADVTMTEPIQAALAQKELLPDQHLLDAGFIEAELLVKAQEELGVEICGPVKKDVHWQAQAGQGFDLTAFSIDWDNQKVTCPEGHNSTGWSEQLNSYGQLAIMVKFKAKVCQACPSRPLCTRSESGGRSLALRPQAEHLALHQRRQAQQTPEFWKTYAQRSGIEGTISQAVRACDLRRSRYVGLAKTHLQLIATATALNFQRLFDWFSQVTPASTRISPFAKLAPEPALLSTSWRF
jgi:transposase